MSWDVLLLSVPPEIKHSSDIPDKYSPTLGCSSNILLLLKDIVPSIDLSDPTWGLLDGPDFSIEFNIGKDDPIATIMLHIRGGEAALGPIEQICSRTGWRAIDFSDGDFIDFSADPGAGLRQWQAYRDHAVTALKEQGASVHLNPRLPGVRVDAIVATVPSRSRWWQFWK